MSDRIEALVRELHDSVIRSHPYSRCLQDGFRCGDGELIDRAVRAGIELAAEWLETEDGEYAAGGFGYEAAAELRALAKGEP